MFGAAKNHDVFDLIGRIALMTGASRGIGYFVAKHMAAAGAHVIAVARTVGGLEELDDEIKATRAETGKGEATLVPLDLADMAGIDRLGCAIHERWGKLDIWWANAGVLGVIAPIGHVEAKTFERVMTINVTSTWRLIRSVDPLLRLSDAGRAILISSSVAHSARAFWAPYAASKAAVEAFARSWADETKKPAAAHQLGRSAPPPARRCARKRCPAKTPRPCRILRTSRPNILQLASPCSPYRRAVRRARRKVEILDFPG